MAKSVQFLFRTPARMAASFAASCGGGWSVDLRLIFKLFWPLAHGCIGF
jgi:hypothetical protein